MDHSDGVDEVRSKIQLAGTALTDNEKAVLELYFGLRAEEPLTAEQIAVRYSTTREKILDIKDRGIAKIE